MTLAQKIKTARELSGKTGKEAAAEAGISYSAWYEIERGEQDVTTEKLIRMARAIGVEPAQLLPETELTASHQSLIH